MKEKEGCLDPLTLSKAAILLSFYNNDVLIAGFFSIRILL